LKHFASWKGEGGRGMPDNNDRIKVYLHSKWYRISSWAGIALIVAYFLAHQLWLLYAALVMAAVAMVPVFRATEFRNQRLDLEKQTDRWYVIVVLLFVTALVVGTYFYVKYTLHP
jgi:hypothetical protein